MADCSTGGCNRPAARASQVHDGRICKVCYTKEWHDRQGPPPGNSWADAKCPHPHVTGRPNVSRSA